MAKKINFGKTNLSELNEVFDFDTDANKSIELKSARLFPNGNVDNETATTSIFLASLCAVKEYREELLSSIGIGKLSSRNATLHAFTEVDSKNSQDRPDGLIVITSGKYTPVIEWACFIESKVRDNQIDQLQIERYSDFAREVGINDIITVSNQLVTTPKDSPVKLKKRSFNLYHWSWTYLKVTATRLIRSNAIADNDHAYILRELRRFFDSHKNLSDYKRMGKGWKEAINEIHHYKEDQKVPANVVDEIIRSYVQEEKDISLQLTDLTKHGVTVELCSKSDRADGMRSSLQKSKKITSEFFINNDKKNKFSVEADFIRQKVTCSTTIIIDKGKAQAQTSALIKHLEYSGSNLDILVTAYYNRRKTKASDTPLANLISERTKGDTYSVVDKSLGDEIKSFEVKTQTLFNKDFQSPSNFVSRLEDCASHFLTQVMNQGKDEFLADD